MVLIKSYSIKWKRNMFCIEMMGISPKGKEKIIKFYLPLPQVQSFIASLKKAVRRQKNKTSDEEVRYIG